MRRIMKLGALALGLLIPLGAATAAQAAQPVPFAISEQVNFVTGVFTAHFRMRSGVLGTDCCEQMTSGGG